MSTRLFLYGTTDVIVGGLTGTNNVLQNNDFNTRGEYQLGPDGCAFDFETAAQGFLVKGNTFSKSFGSGIMIFGHETTSKNITIANNVFDRSGCEQARNDQGGIAVMCPNNQKPTGTVHNNTFFNCEVGSSNAPAIFVSPTPPQCDSGLHMKNNAMYPATALPQRMVTMPQLNFNPSAPTDKATAGTNMVVASVVTLGATLRYTLDGSRPNATSPIVPTQGIRVAWPGPILHINVRAFKAGLLPSITNGALIPLNYGLGRQAPNAGLVGPNNAITGRGVAGTVDSFDSSSRTLTGWGIDYLAGESGESGDARPVMVQVRLDDDVIGVTLANVNRSDLVPAGVAPDPLHGFQYVLTDKDESRLMQEGVHVLSAVVVGSPSSVVPTELPGVVECRRGVCAVVKV